MTAVALTVSVNLSVDGWFPAQCLSVRPLTYIKRVFFRNVLPNLFPTIPAG